MNAAAELLPGAAFAQQSDNGSVETFVFAHDVENECAGCGRLPVEGCACTRETPDLIAALDRAAARRSLRRVAAATNVEPGRAAA